MIVITDLDILTKDFDQLDPNEELVKAHSRLIQAVDKTFEPAIVALPNAKQVKKAQESGEVQLLWRKVRQVRQDVNDGKATLNDLEKVVEEFFAWEKRHLRLGVLKTSKDETVCAAKSELMSQLRKQKVFALEKGALEDYYPETVEGTDKPTKAHDFCRKVTTKDELNALCGDIKHAGFVRKEFEVLCECLVDSVASDNGDVARVPNDESSGTRK